MKLIDLLLKLYPEEFRTRFGKDMRAFHEERIREPKPPWSAIVKDHVSSATREQVRSLLPDIRLALRGMLRRPGFAAVVILTIALGVGANAVMFSLVNGILLRPLPYPAANRLVTLGHKPSHWLVSEPQLAEYHNTLRSFESLAAFTSSEANLQTQEDPVRIAIASVTPGFFPTMGVPPERGRTFAHGEDHTRPAPLVVIIHRLWEERFGQDPAIVGKPLTLNGVPRTIIGVMPAGFGYPSPETRLWLPLCSVRTCASLENWVADSADGWANHYLFVIGRTRPGARLETVRAEANATARRIMRDHPIFNPNDPLVPVLRPLRERLTGASRPYLWALLGAAGFVLLIVCVNVANLLLARGEARRREVALRAALGASRRRLVTQLLTEAVVLASVGGLAGLGLAVGARRVLLALAPASLPRLDQVQIDWVVVAFSFLVSLAAGLLFGVLPAFRGAREAPAESLRTSAKGQGGQPGSRRTQRALAVAEVSLAMVLLAGAGMLLRSLLQLNRTDLGFTPGGALSAIVSPNPNSFDDARAVQFHRRLLESVRAIPGVRMAGAGFWLPVVDAGGLWDFAVEGKSYPPGQGPAAVPQVVTPGFFGALGIRIRAGRDFTEQDREDAPLVTIVSKAFARQIWGQDEPLGRRFRLTGRDSSWMTVVGVVDDILARGATDQAEPTMYVPLAQTMRSWYFTPRAMVLVLRTSGDPATLEPGLRRVVRAEDAAVPVSRVWTLEQVVGRSIANRRFSTVLIAGFAGLALLLAGIGIYGVISYAVSQRTFEIGVRLALGAGRGRVLRLILGDGARMALLGVAIGVLGAVGLARAIRSLLVGIRFVDPPTLLAGIALVIAVALAAAFLPARRATALNPTEALRSGE